MSAWLIAFVGVIYFYIAIEQYVLGSKWMALVFFGYSLSNIGLYQMAAK